MRTKSDQIKVSSRKEYSTFPKQISDLCVDLFLRDAQVVVDAFAGWGERNLSVKESGKTYIGFDLSKEAIEHAKKVYGVENIHGDSLKVDVPTHDGFITCPPYFDLEVYDNENGLDKLNSWDEFLSDYRAILQRFSEKATTGAKYCIITGDWRHKGIYYDLTFQTQKIMSELGFKQFDSVILSRKKKTNYPIMIPQAKRLGYTVKLHETLNVWVKV